MEVEHFNEMKQRMLQHAVAGFLELPPKYVKVLSCREGSTIVEIELPRHDGQRLLWAHQDRDTRFKELATRLRILDVRQEPREDKGEYSLLLQVDSTLVQRVNNFHMIRDLVLAELRAEEIWRQFDEIRTKARVKQDISTEGIARVLEKLKARMHEHLHFLKRFDIEERIHEFQQRLFAQWPADWETPVPALAYEALSHCSVNDPHCLVMDWKSLRVKLDRHQAHYHLRQVLRGISAGHMKQSDAKELLMLALAGDPNIGPVASLIFTFFSLSVSGPAQPELEKIQEELLVAAVRLLETQPLEDTYVSSLAARKDLVRLACEHLQRVVRLFHGMGEKVTALWDGLESSFRPALYEGHLKTVEEIDRMLTACLEVCPTYAPGKAGASWDPRNKLLLMRDMCEVAMLIGKAEENLARQPSYCAAAEQCFVEAIQKQPIDKELWHRAITGFYVARYGRNDPVHAQRVILNELDGWLDQQTIKNGPISIQVEDIVRRIAEFRSQMGLSHDTRKPGPSSTEVDTEPDDGSLDTTYGAEGDQEQRD